MKNLKLKISFFLLITIMFISFSALAQTKPSNSGPTTTISSKITGKNYQLFISLPMGYNAKTDIKHPVLYVMDGEIYYPIINTSRMIMDFNKELESLIIVSVGCGTDLASWMINRSYNFTPTNDAESNKILDKFYGLPAGSIKTGGAKEFLNVLTQEIIPYIDSHYKTNNDRGIYGHSLGGLFASYCFIHSKNVFTRYSINSPAIDFNNNEGLKDALKFFNEHETLDIPPTKVFVTIGKMEGIEGVPQMVEFSTTLEAKKYKNIQLSWQIFDDETHFSVIPISLARTLSVLYRK
ncbi:MAG: hypothetical protein LC122_02690 [Chitinophagales bacterium]|nr:hypothetical protein [Chitinophagales bacterium]